MKKIIVIIILKLFLFTLGVSQDKLSCECRNLLGQQVEDSIDVTLSNIFKGVLGDRLTKEFPKMPSQSQVLFAYLAWTNNEYKVKI